MITVTTDIGNPADVLATDAFGPGAVLRWSHSTDGGLTWDEFATTTILAGISEYTVHDRTGVVSTQYRTQVSTAVPLAPGDYSGFSPVTVPTTSLMGVSEFREHIASDLPDAAIQRLLDANTLAINQRAGPVLGEPATLEGRRSRYIFLDRPIQAITSITEFFNDPVGISGVVLDSTDYRLRSGGTLLERWGYGTHPGDWWSDRVELVYLPVDDTAERIRVLIKLCELDLNRQPGLSAIRIGDYMEQSRNEAYNDEREAILASLVPSALTFA